MPRLQASREVRLHNHLDDDPYSHYEDEGMKMDTQTVATVLRQAFEARAKKHGIDWTPDRIVEQIISCRADCKGIPIFKTKYGGRPLQVDGKPVVMISCWAGKDCRGKYFRNIPEDALSAIASKDGDWKHFLREYASDVPAMLRARFGEAFQAETVI